MATIEEKITQLEAMLENEKQKGSGGSNCIVIAKLELQLSQLYRQIDNIPKSDEMTNEAQRVLEDPTCPQTRERSRLTNYVRYYKSNPNVANVKPMPALQRYMSLIVLVAGYAVIYGLYLLKLINSSYLFIGIIIVFVLSMALSSIVRSRYMRDQRNQRSNNPTSGQSEDIVHIESRINSDETYRNPERILDAARSELTLANIYYQKNNMQEAMNHIDLAKKFLNDPMCESDEAKDQVSQSVNSLEMSIQSKQMGAR